MAIIYLFIVLALNSFLLLFSVPPTVVTLDQPKPVLAGTALSLACTAEDSNPKTNLVWFKGDEPLIEAGN